MNSSPNNPYNNGESDSNNMSEFSNPFLNEFNNNKNNNEQNNQNQNFQTEQVYSNPFKDEMNIDNNNNNNNKQTNNIYKNQNDSIPNNVKNNQEDFSFANPFENEFNNNTNENNINFNNENNDKRPLFNPYSDNINDDKSHNPFEDDNNPFINNNYDNSGNNINNNQLKNNNNSNNQIYANPFSSNNNDNYQNRINQNDNTFQQHNNYNNNIKNNMNPNNNNNFNQMNNSHFNNQNKNSNIKSNNITPNTPSNKEDNSNKESNVPKKIIKESTNDNDNDVKKIKAIINKCESIVSMAKAQYDDFEIREAITTIIKVIKGLDSLKNTINTQKQFCSSLLPSITSLRSKSFSTLQEYRMMVYRLIPIKFKPVLYRPYEGQNESLISFCSKYILNKPFISFDDIFESDSIEYNKRVGFNLNNNIYQAKKTGNKCFLIYGPHGCGKTMYVHAIANQLGAKIAQIEGTELFKIPFFARDFIKACFANMQFKPLIIYMKNIEEMFSTINNFNYIYDKVASSYELNVYFFASSSINIYNLSRQIADKFQFFQLVKPIENINKGDFIKFIGKKIGIEIKVNEKELFNLAMENLKHFSNKDIFDLIRIAIDIKKQNSPPDDENWVYREGLIEDDIMKALGSVEGSLTDDVLKSYYL